MATTATKSRRVMGWRLIVALVVLGFSLQSFVVQTHIHDSGRMANFFAKGLNHDKSPLGNAPLDCPFCQAVAHADAFFMPAALLLFLSQAWLELAAPLSTLSANSGTAAHSWQSRAPPRS
ncbi:MAG: hypothetical protein ABJA60_01505 [Nitrosospira sp.]